MKNKSSIDVKNDFIRNFNLVYRDMEQAIDILYQTSFNKLKLNNIVKIYYDKMLELEEELSKSNIDFWSYDFILRMPLEMDLMDLLLYSFDILDILRTKISPLVILSYSCTGKIANLLLKKELDKYQDICNYIVNYNFKRDIDKSIIHHFKHEHDYKLFVPGSFEKLWKSEQRNLKELNMDNKIIELNKVLIPIIESQEETTTIYHDISQSKVKMRIK